MNIEIKTKPSKISDVVRQVLENLERSDLKKCGKIFVHWKEIVGEQLTCHTKPFSMKGKKLIVHVDSSNWLYEITHHFEKDILKKVQEFVGLGIIEEIHYKVGEV
jgi:predicted nucleic acid-binding Zn ribbon protein